MEIHNNSSEPWKVTLVDTGLNTQTGARIKKIKKYVNETFMLTYSDGVCNADMTKILDFHKSHGKIGTMTSVQPEGRFGALEIDASTSNVSNFREKPKGDGAWINGGFFIFEPKFFDYLEEKEDLILEREPLEKLAKDGELYTYKHDGFWKCMDTLRDRKQLEDMWVDNPAWRVW